MKKYKLLVISLTISFSLTTLAGTSVCTIEIEDNNASLKNKNRDIIVINETFHTKPDADPLTAKQTRFFDLPGGKYLCRLDFYEINTGTSLSCEKKEDKGYSYMQSDRSGIQSNTNINNLTFRNENSHFYIKTICK